jgi:hypothetical protein
MANRLAPINLVTFVGGLNLRRNQFELADDESPDMLNVDIDPRGGFYTRKGWQRWNPVDIVDITTTPWEPRNIWTHVLSDGSQTTYVVSNGIVFKAGNDTTFSAVPAVTAEASPHGCDFTAWGDDVYVAGGMFNRNYRLDRDGTVTTMAKATWSEVEAPTANTMPPSEFITAHGAYVFIAVTDEADGNHWGRIRWSHPGRPDAFRIDDFLDIDVGGGKITGIMSFDDHLLIFKSTTMWGLYGNDIDTWQLIPISSKVGCPTITAMTRSETTTYFYSASDQGGVYAYQGGHVVYLSEALAPAFEETFVFNNVFVSWAGRRLWVSVPWLKGVGTMEQPTTTFVFDPNVGQGAWTMYRSEVGALGLVTDNSDIASKFPLAVLWSTATACVVQLDYIDDAYDVILDQPVLGTEASVPDNPDAPYLVTGDDAEIVVSGDVFVGIAFDSYYRTKWIHGGWPDRKKSWRRPTFVCRQVPRDTDLIVETYRDYNETNVHRSRTLKLRTQGGFFWTEEGFVDPLAPGFDWTSGGRADPTGRGGDWGAEEAGSTLVRAGSQGLARAIQMKVRASPTTPRQKWGVDGIVAKIVMRRFR